MLRHGQPCLLQGSAGGPRYQTLIGSHTLPHGPLILDQLQVSGGYQTQHPASVLDHRESSDAELHHQPPCIPYGGVGSDGVGVFDDLALVPLDPAHLADLHVDGQEAVNHAYAAELGHGHGSLGDGVHVGADERGFQVYLAGKGGGAVGTMSIQILA